MLYLAVPAAAGVAMTLYYCCSRRRSADRLVDLAEAKETTLEAHIKARLAGDKPSIVARSESLASQQQDSGSQESKEFDPTFSMRGHKEGQGVSGADINASFNVQMTLNNELRARLKKSQ